MYSEGDGVLQDYVEAVKWHRLGAERGDEFSRGELGFDYLLGRGVPQDYVIAHMWFNIAASTGGISDRDLAEKHMTSQQIAVAQSMARACQARNFKGCD